MSTKERNIGIDLLRIFAMLCVVLVHVLSHGGAMEAAALVGGGRYYALKLIQVFGYCAVPVYAIISGYVGVGRKSKFSNLFSLMFTALFYTILFSAIFYFLKPDEVGVREMLKAMIPDYWYLLCYCGLFLFMPFLNHILETLEQKTLFQILLLIFVIFSCTSPIFMAMGRDPFGLLEGFSVLWLIVFYLVGGYLKLYGICKTKIKTKMSLLLFGCILLTFLSKVATNLLGYGNMNLLYHYLSPTIFLAAIALVTLFANMKIGCEGKHIITYLSTFTFAIYLIHQQELVNMYCIQNQFSWVVNYHFLLSVILVIACSLAIYILCTIIDIARLYLFRLLHIKKLAVYLEKLCSRVGNWLTNKMKVNK